MTPPHDLELSLGPRNHGNRGCPSIWSWWNILLVPNWTLRIVPNWAFWYVPFLSLEEFQYLKLWIPQFPRVPLKIAGAKPLQFSHNNKLMDAPSFQEFPWKLQGRSPCNFPIIRSLWMYPISRSSIENCRGEAPAIFPQYEAYGSSNIAGSVSAGAQFCNFAEYVSAVAQSSNFGWRFCWCPIQLFFIGLKHLLYIY